MQRREFIILFGGAIAWPLGARAQQPNRLRRVGVLVDSKSSIYSFEQGLAEFGWTQGRNIIIDRLMYGIGPADWASPASRAYVAELVAAKPDVILAKDTQDTKMALEQTHIVPIVFAMCADPVWRRSGRELGATRRQCHRILQFRTRDGRQVDRVA
jgi:putative ABC transport system substrate-binding protein